MSNILLVDDEKYILKSLSLELQQSEGYDVITAQNGKEALGIIASSDVDLVMLDVLMPEMDGIVTLRKIKNLKPDLPVIMMSAQGTIEMAVKATKLGAYDFIEKGTFDLDPVLVKIKNALGFTKLEKENIELRELLNKRYNMVGSSLAMQELYAQIERSGPSDGRVLIYGENGTGKELVAHAIHDNSNRKNKPFVKVNCAAIPDDLIESELFGHEKGAFTGAISQIIGKFESANGGTIFLDEIGDMSLKTQAKVLRAIQEGEIERIGGGGKTIKVNVRIIAATNKDLLEEIEKGNFREDLYYRLNVIPILILPLREHKEDIPDLVMHFVDEYCKESGKKPKVFSSDAIEVLMNHSWPGNIRQLKNVIERMMIMINHDDIMAIDVKWALGMSQEKKVKIQEENTLKDMVYESERDIIISALEANDWNVSRTAQQLKLERSYLHKKMNKLGIKKPYDR